MIRALAMARRFSCDRPEEIRDGFFVDAGNKKGTTKFSRAGNLK